MAKKKSVWRFTPARRLSMAKAQKRHQTLVILGKRAWARGER